MVVITASAIQLRLRSTDPLEVSAAIVECFEVGYFPWQSAEFRVYLYEYLREQIFTPDQLFMRGVILSRYAATIMPDGVDDRIKADLAAWGECCLAERDYDPASSFPRSNWPRQNKIASPWSGVAFWNCVFVLHNRAIHRQMRKRGLAQSRSRLRAHLGLR